MATFQFAADTAANWASNNRTPLLDEVCYESDTHLTKLGDGATAYNSLPYTPEARSLSRQRDSLPTTTFSGCYAETFPRSSGSLTASGLATGIPRLIGITLYAGEIVTTLGFVNGATALASATHQWAALADSSGTVLAVSPDGTSGAWATSAAKSYTMASPYTVTTTGSYFLAVCVVATTPPSPMVSTGSTNLTNLVPMAACTAASNTGAPPSVGASLGTLSVITTALYATVA